MHAKEYPFVKIFSVTKPKPNGLDQYYAEFYKHGMHLNAIGDHSESTTLIIT